jgi:hypothetical protein
VGKGYAEGPAAEEAQARLDALELDRDLPPRPTVRSGVFGSTEVDPSPHFLGWADEVDADELFASGQAWGITVMRVSPDAVSP